MHPFPSMEPPSRQDLVEAQQAHTFYGSVVYESALETKTVSGWLFYASNLGFLFVFGDNASLIGEQKRVLIPFHRIIEITADHE
jgi:hypothetical protein